MGCNLFSARPSPHVHMYFTMPALSVELLASSVHWSVGHEAVKRATGGEFGTGIVIDRVTGPVAALASFAVSVIVCEPVVSVLVEKDTPVPIWPSRLLVHTSELPVRTPSSGSVPVPAKLTGVPGAKLALLSG